MRKLTTDNRPPTTVWDRLLFYGGRWSVVGGLFLFLSACGGGNNETGPLGETTYRRVCATCHQADGMGLPPTFPPLTHSEWVSGSKDDLIRIVLHGLRGPIIVDGTTYNNIMAGWGTVLSDDQVAAVLTYVRETFADSASAVTPAEVAAVRQASGRRRTPWTAEELKTVPSH